MKGAPKPAASMTLTLMNTAVLWCQAWDGSWMKGNVKNGQEKDSS